MYSVLLSDYELGMKLVLEDLKKIIKEDSKVVVLPWTFPVEINIEKFETEWFAKKGKRYNKYINSLLTLGIKEENIKILNCYDKRIAFKEEIDKSDILVLTGGNPEMLFSKVTQETEVLYNIKHYKGIIIGGSAGAELQLKRYFITAKNNYYKYFAFYDGFGVLNDPFYFDVHTVNNKNYLQKLQNTANEKQKNVYAIYDDGAILVNRNTNDFKIYGHVTCFEHVTE